MLPDFSSIRAKEKYFRALEGELKYDALNESIGHVLNTVELSHKRNRF